MYKYLNFLLFAFFFTPFACISQKTTVNKNAKEHYMKAERLMAEQHFLEAINEYKKTLDSDPNSTLKQGNSMQHKRTRSQTTPQAAQNPHYARSPTPTA